MRKNKVTVHVLTKASSQNRGDTTSGSRGNVLESKVEKACFPNKGKIRHIPNVNNTEIRNKFINVDKNMTAAFSGQHLAWLVESSLRPSELC